MDELGARGAPSTVSHAKQEVSRRAGGQADIGGQAGIGGLPCGGVIRLHGVDALRIKRRHRRAGLSPKAQTPTNWVVMPRVKPGAGAARRLRAIYRT